MRIKYKFFFGGDKNPYGKELDEVYDKITQERLIADPQCEKFIQEIFPTLDSWPDFVLANSRSVFWLMERAINLSEDGKEEEIEEIWEEAERSHSIGDWLLAAEADDSEKAMCYYMASLHHQFDPEGFAVDFRLYISENKDIANFSYDRTEPFED